MGDTSTTLTTERPDQLNTKAVLLVNTHSRRGKDWYEQAKVHLKEAGVHLVDSQEFQKVDKLQHAVKKAVAAKTPLVIIGGGDGTFSATAKYFVDSESTLGVLPLGTGNAFARDLGIVADVATATKTIASGRVTNVDLGYAYDDYFLNVASIGLTTRIAAALTDPMKHKYGRFVYVVALVKAMATVQPFQVKLETENGTEEFETMLAVIGNGRYHAGPFRLSETASITEGKLSFYALATARKSAFIRFGLALATGRQGHLPEVRTQETTGGTITTTPSKKVTVDGEIYAQTPMKFKIVPKALRVLVPPEFSG